MKFLQPSLPFSVTTLCDVWAMSQEVSGGRIDGRNPS